jgi:hypothetical protein
MKQRTSNGAQATVEDVTLEGGKLFAASSVNEREPSGKGRPRTRCARPVEHDVPREPNR